MHQTEYVADRTKLRGRRNLQVLSLGAGVQSTVMALMAEQEYEGFTKPDLAIFADTGWEPQAVYDHLDWLEQQLSYPVIRVTNGNIRDDILQGVNPEGRKFIDIPVFVVKDDGKHYVGTRQCTKTIQTETDSPVPPKISRLKRRQAGTEGSASGHVAGDSAGTRQPELSRASRIGLRWYTHC